MKGLIPTQAARRQRPRDHCNLEARLVFIASSRPARVTWPVCFKKTKRNRKRKGETIQGLITSVRAGAATRGQFQGMESDGPQKPLAHP